MKESVNSATQKGRGTYFKGYQIILFDEVTDPFLKRNDGVLKLHTPQANALIYYSSQCLPQRQFKRKRSKGDIVPPTVPSMLG